MSDLPLSDLRRSLLSALEYEPENLTWASVQLLTWGRRRGYIERAGISTAHQLTELGRLVLKIDREHGFSLHSRTLGRSPIAGGGAIHGAGLRCRCGWKTQNNERPASRGGNTVLKGEHRAHVAAILAAEVAAA